MASLRAPDAAAERDGAALAGAVWRAQQRAETAGVRPAALGSADRARDVHRAVDSLKRERQAGALRLGALLQQRQDTHEAELESARVFADERGLASMQLWELQERSAGLAARIARQEAEAEREAQRYRAELEWKEGEARELRARLEAVAAETERRRAAVAALERELSERDAVALPALEHQLQGAAEAVRSAELQRSVTLDQVAAESGALRKELQAERDAAQRLRAEVSACERRRADADAQAGELAAELAGERNRAQLAARSRDQLLPEIERLRAAAGAAQRAEAELHEQAAEQEQLALHELRMKEDTVRELRREGAELRGAVAELTAAVQRSLSVAADWARRSDHARERVEQLRAVLKHTEAQREGASQALRSVHARNKELERLHMGELIARLEHVSGGELPPAAGGPEEPPPFSG